MGRFLTQETIISRFEKVHGDDFDNFWVFYINRTTHVLLVCNHCGYAFWRTPNEHLLGRKCMMCSSQKVGKNLALTTEEFIRRAEKAHPNANYDYSRVVYINNMIKVEIICPEHGSFWARPSGHLKGVKCKKCEIKRRNKTTEEFVKDAELAHPNANYDYSQVNYVNSQTKVEIICPIHGSFWMLPHNHLSGSGCPQCKASKGEKWIRNLLLENNIQFKQEHSFLNCINPKTGKALKFDFYLPKLNCCVEFDGIQHFEAFDHFGGEKIFKETQMRDLIKDQYCSMNNIRLIRINHNQDIKEII